MQFNWSLVLNALLLMVVIGAIVYLVKNKLRSKESINSAAPSLGMDKNISFDDVISVRKIEFDEEETAGQGELNIISSNSLMMFLLAKESRLLAGYELLQTLLAAGLRFGEGQLFHRHQFPNGQGPVLCTLAAATPQGTFDLQNIGAFRVRGLCLFMQASGNPTIDAERFAIMLETARQLSDGLDTHLLDDRKEPLKEASLKRYYQSLNLNEHGVYSEAV